MPANISRPAAPGAVSATIRSRMSGVAYSVYQDDHSGV